MVMKNKAISATLGLLALVTFGMANSAQAAFTLTIAEVGDDVTITGSGSLDLDDLSAFASSASDGIYINPASGIVSAGTDGFDATLYLGVTGPASLGPGSSNVFAELFSGDYFIVGGSFGAIGVNSNYISGTFFTNSATFENQSLSTLGLTPGTYVYTWGTGENADSVTVNVNAVPEPASTALLAIGGCALLLGMRKRRNPSLG